MPLNHSVHAHIKPCYVTTPTRHDYVHALPSPSVSLTELLANQSVRRPWRKPTLGTDESVGWAQQSQPELRSLRWATATIARFSTISLTLSELHLSQATLVMIGLLERRSHTRSTSIIAVLIALSSCFNMSKVMEHKGTVISEGLSRLSIYMKRLVHICAYPRANDYILDHTSPTQLAEQLCYSKNKRKQV